jgi:hypothetical protein
MVISGFVASTKQGSKMGNDDICGLFFFLLCFFRRETMLGKQRKAIEALAQTLSDMATRSHTTLFKDLRERAKQHRALHPTVEEEVIPLDVVDEHGNVIQAPPKEESALDYDGAPPEFLERTKPIGINLQKLKTKSSHFCSWICFSSPRGSNDFFRALFSMYSGRSCQKACTDTTC